MTSDRLLVIGGTGLVGQPVACALRGEGYTVRLLVRDARRARALLGEGYELVEGDVTDGTAVERALDGCAAVHVSLRAAGTPQEMERVEHQGVVRVAAAARRIGIARLMYVSGSFVGEPLAAGAPGDQAKRRAEEAIRTSGVPYTIFRPTYFMDTLPRHIQGRFAVVLGRQRQALRMVAATDFAAMVVRAWRVPQAAGCALYIQGPEAITIPDALRQYCRLVEPGKRAVTVPLGIMAAVDSLLAGGKLRHTLDVMRLLQRVGEPGDAGEANRLLGAPTTTVREWCERRRAARQGVHVAENGQRRPT